ncbi:MAG: hypothetical protein R3233_00200 [Xanthomonadales bacterium]|nr:hypothetical protein [Xanthomonadales bacterium]
MAKLLLISRDCLQNLPEADRGRGCRALARLHRQGNHLLLTAAQPERWAPTRGSADNALDLQARLQEEIQSCGGEIDGVYYVARSLFTQDRNRRGALGDIMQRYGLKPAEVRLFSHSARFVGTARRLGIEAELVDEERGPGLLECVERVAEAHSNPRE